MTYRAAKFESFKDQVLGDIWFRSEYKKEPLTQALLDSIAYHYCWNGDVEMVPSLLRDKEVMVSGNLRFVWDEESGTLHLELVDAAKEIDFDA